MFMAMILLGGFFSLWIVGDLSTPILTSIVLALLFRPMQVYFTKIGVPERLSVFITFFTAVLLATLFLLIFIPLFVNEAKKLYQKEFKKWFQLTTELVPLLKFFRQIEIKIPTYYIMGDQDYMFLPSVKNLVKVHNKSELHVIQNCGHVVNIDKPEIFNKRMSDFLERSI